MRKVTTIWFASVNDNKDKRRESKVSYNTSDPAIAMRRFFAERGNKTWLVPVRIETVKEA